MSNDKVKKPHEMSERAWRLLKAYAGYIGVTIGEANEQIILEKLDKLEEVLENV